MPDKTAIETLQNMAPWVKASTVPSGVDGDDDVYPLHMLDDTKGCREFFLAWTLRFNDVLDVQKLHDTLSSLLEIGDWRKLGGRLRMNVRSYSVFSGSRMMTGH